MKHNQLKNWLNRILCAVLVAAMTLTLGGCSSNEPKNPETPQSEVDKRIVKGEGQITFNFDVTDQEGNTTQFEIHTDEETVGAALLKLELIKGDPGDYGLYVKEVNGIIADYDKDQTYWAFYINGEYAMSGVDQTKIEEGASYAFKIEK